MNNQELIKKVNMASQSILNRKNFIAPVDVLSYKKKFKTIRNSV